MALTTQEKVDYIRLFLPDTVLIPDQIINLFVVRWETQMASTPDNDYIVIYNAMVDTLNWVILQLSTQAISGRHYEMEGQLQIDRTDSDPSTGYRKFLDYLLANPNIVDPSLTKSTFNNIIVGGVSQEEVARVKNDPDSRGNGYSLGEFYSDEFCPDNIYSSNFKSPRRRFYN